jgi:hypothetical protein
VHVALDRHAVRALAIDGFWCIAKAAKNIRDRNRG